MPSHGINGQPDNLVTMRHFRGEGPGLRPLVIVLPIWGVHRFPPDTLVAGLTKRAAGNVDVLQFEGEHPLMDWDAIRTAPTEEDFGRLLDRSATRIEDTVIDIRRVVDWAEKQPGIDREKIALVGFSRGAVIGSVALVSDPRFAAGVVVMGAADPHIALAHCDKEIKRAREQVMARFSWTREEYAQHIEPHLVRVNSASYPGRVDPARILIIEAAEDSCMPEPSRSRLWTTMGQPERIRYAYDHKTSFLAMTFLGGGNLQKHVYRFLDKCLAHERPLLQAGSAITLPACRPSASEHSTSTCVAITETGNR